MPKRRRIAIFIATWLWLAPLIWSIDILRNRLWCIESDQMCSFPFAKYQDIGLGILAATLLLRWLTIRRTKTP